MLRGRGGVQVDGRARVQVTAKTFENTGRPGGIPPARSLRWGTGMRTLYVFPFALLASTVSACTAGTTTPPPSADPTNDPATVQSALEQENGGLDMADEPPAFGDPSVSDAAPMDAPPADITDAPDADLPTMRSYRVALTWGHLPQANDASDADPTPSAANWSGSISVDAGAIAVKRVIRFDRFDRLERRDDKAEVSFVSRTLPHVDGLLVQVVVPAAGSQTLHFKTDTLTFDIDLTALAKDGFARKNVNDGWNGVSVAGYADVKDCARGFVAGRWIKKQPALGGFRGRVVDGNGDLLGHTRGIWGHAPKKNQDLFFGKYIGTNGQTRGLFGGTYGAGEFKGVWGTVNPANAGGLHGVYSDGYENDDGRGVWLARWSEKCGS